MRWSDRVRVSSIKEPNDVPGCASHHSLLLQPTGEKRGTERGETGVGRMRDSSQWLRMKLCLRGGDEEEEKKRKETCD